MNKKNLEILGLSEGATYEDIKAAYEALRAKYLEERFMDGDVGNNAANMLTKIDNAYNELTNELRESEHESAAGTEDLYYKTEELIKAGDLAEAQRVLDGFNERGGRWHYLQSVVFYRKNWINESKKQLEIAMQLEPDNAKYKEAYRKLNDKINYEASAGAAGAAGTAGSGSAYRGQTMDSSTGDGQMGGNFCAQCLDCCYTYMCISCLCDGCCR